MPEVLEQFSADWWRFGDYEYRDGCLCPVPNAQPESYDPWKMYGRASDERVDHPLDELLAIFNADADQLPPLPKVLEWSRLYGPLGILPCRTVAAAMPLQRTVPSDASRIENVIGSLGGAAESREARALARCPYKSRVIRFLGGWLENEQFFSMQAAEAVASEPTDVSPGMVVLKKPIRAKLTTDTIGDAWGPFFPHVAVKERESYDYPRPGTEEFARRYCEPLDEWARWARALTRAIAKVSLSSSQQRVEGAVTLCDLAGPMYAMPILREGKPTHLAWRTPSLLSSLALMAMQRLAGGARARRCKDPQCGIVFLPTNDRNEYHDKKCRWRHVKAEQRSSTRVRKRTKRTKRYPAKAATRSSK